MYALVKIQRRYSFHLAVVREPDIVMVDIRVSARRPILIDISIACITIRGQRYYRSLLSQQVKQS